MNYEVMGANLWRHAPTLAAMASETLRFHLSAMEHGNVHRLSDRRSPGDAWIAQTVDLADRSDADSATPGGGILDRQLDTSNGLVFASDPLTAAVELSGLFSGRLDLIANKRDLDLTISLYELTPRGDYMALSYLIARASFLQDRTRRRLLTPGRRQQLDFASGRLTSRRFQAGSRLVVVLAVVKGPAAQINHGTGKDVSDETIADAREPLRLKWFDASYIDVPARR